MASTSSSDKHQLAIEDASKDTVDTEDGVVTIDVDGTPVKLDKLGPMIINSDGTISRITTWAEMSEIERNRALRLMVKRNHMRLKKLDQEHKDNGEERVSALREASA
ncbi:hypothetical protein CspeluHIS016_0100880 [Cutaneotrichosporon spelunceum]|uniref:Uncharacterized protein n=1 Tax=Cutaneotrichosporon spelunceum TaxID=1672016 RepID=A0AAD3TN64_9TREE|nr:hypothetical protein CspeluHIS016_0100880 [Cutaneotrichosporon spelunceum]